MVWFEFSLDMYYDYVTVWEWYRPKELEYNKIMYYNWLVLLDIQLAYGYLMFYTGHVTQADGNHKGYETVTFLGKHRTI